MKVSHNFDAVGGVKDLFFPFVLKMQSKHVLMKAFRLTKE